MELSPAFCLNSFWSSMSLQDFLFKTQDNISGGGIEQKLCFQPSSGCFQHCKRMAFATTSLWKYDVIHLPASLYLHLSHCPPYQKGFMACLIAAHFTFTCAIASIVNSIPQSHLYIAYPPWCPEA